MRVDASTSIANAILIPALPDFFERYPDIVLDLGSGDRPVNLIEEGVDCAIRGGELPDSGLIARRIGILEFITCASPAYLARHGRPQHPHQLAQHRCLRYFSAKTGKSVDWEFRRGEEQLRIVPPAQLALNDATAHASAGLAGLGVLRMARYAAEPLIASGRLEQLLPDWHGTPLPLHVVYPHNRHLSAKVRVFVEWVADLVGAHPGLQLRTE